MKKLIVGVLLLMMALFGLAACGGGDEESGGTDASAEYANTYDEVEELAPEKTFFKGELVYDAEAEAAEEGSTAAYDTEYTIITNGDVHQVEGDVENPTAVVLKGDTIEFVGSDEEALKYDDGNATVIDAEGMTVMPGMAEAHMHPQSMGTSAAYEIVVSDIQDPEKILGVIKDFVEKNPDLNVYSGRGWDVSIFGLEGPKKEDLDAICSDKAIIMRSSDGHSTWCNSKALEVAGITKDTKVDGGEIILGKDGEPQGYLKENAGNLLSDQKPVYNKEQMKGAIEWVQNYLNSQGFTTIFCAGMNPDSDQAFYEAAEEMAENGDLKLNIRASWWVQPYNFKNWDELKAYLDRCRGIAAGFKTEQFQANTIKMMTDQVLEEATAYVEYYEDPEDHSSAKKLDESKKLWKGKEDMLREMYAYAVDNGMQVHMHQIGDPAAQYALDAIEDVSKDHPDIVNSRFVFAHCQFLTDETQKRMKKAGMVAVVPPYWAVIDDYYWDIYEPLVGVETLRTQYPMESLVNNGVTVAFHSDSPVTTPEMGWVFYSALTRTLPQKMFNVWYGEDSDEYVRVTDPEAPQDVEDIETVYGGKQPIAPNLPTSERMPMDDVIKAATYGGAYSMKMEDTVGTLEVGKEADVLILNQNLSDWKLKDGE